MLPRHREPAHLFIDFITVSGSSNNWPRGTDASWRKAETSLNEFKGNLLLSKEGPVWAVSIGLSVSRWLDKQILATTGKTARKSATAGGQCVHLCAGHSLTVPQPSLVFSFSSSGPHLPVLQDGAMTTCVTLKKVSSHTPKD